MCSINQHSNTHQALADNPEVSDYNLHFHTKTCYHIVKSGFLLVADPNTPTDTYFSCSGSIWNSRQLLLGAVGGASVRYAGEATNALGGREEEVAESDTTTWSQWGYRRLMIKAKGVHGRQTHVCVAKTHGTARVGDFSFPKNLNWSFAVKKDAGLGLGFFWDEHTQLSE